MLNKEQKVKHNANSGNSFIIKRDRTVLCAVLFKCKIENMKKNNIKKMPKEPSAENGTKPNVSSSTVEDVFINLFSDKYERDFKINVLSQCECDKTLKNYIKKYQPKYYIEGWDEVASITLAKDMGMW
jgi:hypothetical protein